jgi:hypothetical protein
MRLLLLFVTITACRFALPDQDDVLPPPPPSPSEDADVSMFDPNGVRQIYATRLDRARPWTLGFDDWQARTRGFDAATAEGEGAATTITASGQVRLNVASEDTPCTGDPDQGAALARGFMCLQNDWYAFEITAYVQLVDAATTDDDRNWVWYGGGGRHTGDGAPDGCTGSAYKASYHYATGEVRVRKENFHVNYFNRDWKPVAGGIDFAAHPDQWLGMKLVRYEVVRDGVRGMRLEQYLDLAGIDAEGHSANAWTLVNVEEDLGGWSSGATACGAPTTDQPMLWGGPWATFRWDNTTSRTRLMSVREIVPPETPPLDAPAAAR